MKISVAILAKNEAEMLPDALKSVAWADEIVVGVDSATTDETARIANEAGAITIPIVFNGFAGAKNTVISACTSDWVLILDADERVDEPLRNEIQALLPTDDIGGYRLERRNFSMGVELLHGGWERDTQLRLVRRQGSEYSGQVHEEMKVPGSVEMLKNALIHFSHRSVAGLIATINQYTDLEAQRFEGPAPSGFRGLVGPAAKEFVKRYWKMKGYRDGTVGLIEAGCSAFYMFASKAKIWEKNRKR